MKNYLLIWSINDYPEMGGGIDYDFFEDIESLENKVNELNKDYKERFQLDFACEIESEIELKPVEKIIRWEADK